HHALIAIVPALVYVLIVAAALAAALPSLRCTRANLVRLATIVLLIGLPPANVYMPLLLADTHGASLLLSLLALMLLAALASPDRTRRPLLPALAFALLTAATVASDPYALVFAFGPASLVIALDFLAERESPRTLPLLALTAAAALAGALVPSAIARLGGFVTKSTVETGFVAPHALGGTITAFFLGLLYISGAYVFGKSLVSVGALACLARLAGWAFGAAAVLRRVPALWRAVGPATLDRFFLASIAVVAPACILSRMFATSIQDQIRLGGHGTRYLSPVIVFAAILAARAAPSLIAALPTSRFRLAALALGAVLSVGLLAGHSAETFRRLGTPPWMGSSPDEEAARWLEAHHLACGIGEYWSASIVTALTDGRVTVRPAKAPKHLLLPLPWTADAHWFAGPDLPAFAIWREEDEPLYRFDARAVAATYGPPTRILRVAGFTIALLPGSPHPHALAIACPQPLVSP
ncbi:MAG TPA: hypothetical protein VMA86_02790, partial [Acetobacteraceae bacterium]|nr:hypothetical protein [Acetobacteraceae bacterium]